MSQLVLWLLVEGTPSVTMGHCLASRVHADSQGILNFIVLLFHNKSRARKSDCGTYYKLQCRRKVPTVGGDSSKLFQVRRRSGGERGKGAAMRQAKPVWSPFLETIS